MKKLTKLLFLIILSGCFADTGGFATAPTKVINSNSDISLSFQGVKGSASDSVIDSYFSELTAPEFHWNLQTSADVITATIFSHDLSSTICAPKTLSSTSIEQVSFDSCTLTDGTQYQLELKASFTASTEAAKVFTFSFSVDNTAPTPPNPADLILYSKKTGGLHGSLSTTPDIKVQYSGAETGSGLTNYMARVIETAGFTEVVPWTASSDTEAFSLSGLSLTDGEDYRVEVKAVDRAGNESAALSHSNGNFSISKIDWVYDGLSLPDTSASSDATLSSASFSGSSYSRTAPFTASTLNISGTTSPNVSENWAMFIRSSLISFSTDSKLDVSGQNGQTTSTGVAANGGSGGSGGASSVGACSSPIAGGSGNNGSSSFGSGGLGSGLVYNSGFSYASGGKGAHPGGSTGTNIGGPGFGGGGFGMQQACSSRISGGGGGGLIVLESNSVTGHGELLSKGGYSSQNSGGGGVLYVSFESYNRNIFYNVAAGRGSSYNAANGSVRIYQKLSDGSYIQRTAADSWTKDGVASQLELPFPQEIIDGLPLQSSATLTSQNLATKDYSPINPLQYDSLVINGAISWTGGVAAIFIAADDITFSGGASISANGKGRDGGSGGGNYGTCATGGNGGSGTHARYSGSGSGHMFEEWFDWGTGGNGGTASNDPGTPGAGGVGFGGGGSGARGGCVGQRGGAGGGLVAIYANSISGSGSLAATGAIATSPGGSGGGGVIWVATKSYDGNLSADVSAPGPNAGTAGTARIFQVLSDGSLIERSFTDTW